MSIDSRDPKSFVSRRAFLQRASLILASASIAPWVKRDIFNVLKNSMLPEAYANSANAVDFVIDLGIPASFPLGDMFPPAGFIRPDSDRDRGCVWKPEEMEQVRLDNGRTLQISQAAQRLKPFANNIAIVESVREYIGAHPSFWPVRVGGFYVGHSGDQPNKERYGASIGSLFAATVAANRGPNSSPIPGLVKENGQVEESYGTPGGRVIPRLAPMTTGVAQLADIFRARPRTLSNSELRRIIDAVKQINNVQLDAGLRMRLQGADNARTAAEQGVALITTERAVDLPTEWNSLASKFFAGPGQDDYMQAQRADERSDASQRRLGESLLKSFLGFKYNILGSTSIGVSLGHPHFAIPQLGDNSTREATRYVGERLGALLEEARNTDHPFRPGRKLFDHMLIMISTDTHRDVTMKERNEETGEAVGGYHWGETDRMGVVVIGGRVNGGYLGDVELPRGSVATNVLGFDFNTGAVNSRSRPTNPMLYKTIALAAGVPANEVATQMRENANAQVISALFRA
jgi:hypothetical protein